MIKIIYTKKEMQIFSLSYAHKKIGLVPTMGNLHDGHLSLLAKSLKENDISIISIFVNPTQFGPNEDYDKYPRTLASDLTKIESLYFKAFEDKELVIFTPSEINEIYPKNFSTTISIGPLKDILCGKFRPTHFDGVTTIVFKLFHLIKPTDAYFGQKDYQQCVIIKKMISDLELDIKMHILPIVRNSMGLALSSRNQYLKESEVETSLTLYRTLNQIKELIIQKKDFKDFIVRELNDSRYDYLEVRDANTLDINISNSKSIVILGVFRIGNTRLLDNLLVNLND